MPPFVCGSTADTDALVVWLRSAQRVGGAWGYHGAASWTEPTALALLALAGNASDSESQPRGVAWLQSMQRQDGGWPPHPDFPQSTWVTALAALALAPHDSGSRLDRAVAWLLRQSGEESSLLARIRRRLLGQQLESGEGTVGWPWLAGTAGWVAPTALAVLALERIAPLRPSRTVLERIRQGKEFLLARMCADGGWNYGGPRALGYEARSYPETTGLALLALRGHSASRVGKSLDTAAEHLTRSRSAQGQSWLHLALLAHGRSAVSSLPCLPCRDVLDVSLVLLARAAVQGDPVFWRDS